MKVAIFFVLTAVLRIASCDMICMQFKKTSCSRMITVRDRNNPFCSSIDERNECVRIAARECGVESSPIVGELVERQTEACKEGTEMNDWYEKNKTCLYYDTATGNDVCMRPMMTELETLGFPSLTRTYLVKSLKVACKFSVSGNKCVDDNVNTTCGAKAAKFRHQLSDPSIRLFKQVCEEVDLEIEPETKEIHSVLQQHDKHSVHSMTTYIQHISTIDLEAGSSQIVSTIAPRQYPAPKSGANNNEPLQIIYVLVASICIKWFSPY